MRTTRRQRAQFIEPLEGRLLLSGVSSSDQPATAGGRVDSVVLIERDVARDDAADTPVPVEAIPTDVLAAFRAKFPGAEVVDATFSSDDGPEYDLSARYNGREISAEVKPNGDVIETDENGLRRRNCLTPWSRGFGKTSRRVKSTMPRWSGTKAAPAMIWWSVRPASRTSTSACV
jgi:hypothetical protein